MSDRNAHFGDLQFGDGHFAGIASGFDAAWTEICPALSAWNNAAIAANSFTPVNKAQSNWSNALKDVTPLIKCRR